VWFRPPATDWMAGKDLSLALIETMELSIATYMGIFVLKQITAHKVPYLLT